MSTDNTLHRQFLAQYYLQEVLILEELVYEYNDGQPYPDRNEVREVPLDEKGIIFCLDYNHPIVLKPLTCIDEETIAGIAEICNIPNHTYRFVKDILYIENKSSSLTLWYKNCYSNPKLYRNGFEVIEYTLDISDYLRSKSYALPWRGITVTEQIKNNWINLYETI